MSQIVTPPDVVDQFTVYLVVNPHIWDVEMMVKWLQMTNQKYTIHLYRNEMNTLDWLTQVSKISKKIIVDRQQTDRLIIEQLLDHSNKINWYGTNQRYTSATGYLIEHG